MSKSKGKTESAESRALRSPKRLTFDSCPSVVSDPSPSSGLPTQGMTGRERDTETETQTQTRTKTDSDSQRERERERGRGRERTGETETDREERRTDRQADGRIDRDQTAENGTEGHRQAANVGGTLRTETDGGVKSQGPSGAPSALLPKHTEALQHEDCH